MSRIAVRLSASTIASESEDRSSCLPLLKAILEDAPQTCILQAEVLPTQIDNGLVCLFRGSEEQLLDLVDDLSLNKNVRLLIPKASVARVIGRNGRIIQSLQKQSKATIEVIRQILQDEERICVVRGDSEAIRRCVQLLLPLIQPSAPPASSVAHQEPVAPCHSTKQTSLDVPDIGSQINGPDRFDEKPPCFSIDTPNDGGPEIRRESREHAPSHSSTSFSTDGSNSSHSSPMASKQRRKSTCKALCIELWVPGSSEGKVIVGGKDVEHVHHQYRLCQQVLAPPIYNGWLTRVFC